MNPAALTIKKNNKKKILNYTITNEDATRIKLSSALGLSAGTITNLVTELIHQNLLLEGKEAYYKHGRKTKFLKFNGDYAYILCAEMSEQDALILTVCNLLGEKIVSEAIRMSFTASSDNSVQNIMRTFIGHICSFINQLEDSIRQKLCALAVSINGMVDTNKMIDMPLYNWQNVNLSTPLEAAVHLPIYIDNISRIKSVYETRYVSHTVKNIIYLNLSPGIGIAHYFNGKLICGLNGISGEAGHMTLKVDGEKCYCGNSGCFEVYCGHKALLNRLKKGLSTLGDYDVLYRLVVEQQMPLTLDTLDLALKKGSIYASELLMETGKYLGYGLVNLINIFDPDLFIISGYGMDFDPFVLEVALAEARSRIVNTFRREIRIEHARLKKEENYKALTAYVLNDKLDELASR